MIFATLPVHDSFCDSLKVFIGIALQNLDGKERYSGGPQTPEETRYLKLFKTTIPLDYFSRRRQCQRNVFEQEFCFHGDQKKSRQKKNLESAPNERKKI